MTTNTLTLHETAPPPARRALRRAGKLLTAATVALAPITAAQAQTIGAGGGGTILNAAVNYFENNIAADLGTLAVICIGIFLLAMRVSWMVIIAVCAGIEVIFNASTISSALHG